MKLSFSFISVHLSRLFSFVPLSIFHANAFQTLLTFFFSSSEVISRKNGPPPGAPPAGPSRGASGAPLPFTASGGCGSRLHRNSALFGPSVLLQNVVAGATRTQRYKFHQLKYGLFLLIAVTTTPYLKVPTLTELVRSSEKRGRYMI